MMLLKYILDTSNYIRISFQGRKRPAKDKINDFERIITCDKLTKISRLSFIIEIGIPIKWTTHSP